MNKERIKVIKDLIEVYEQRIEFKKKHPEIKEKEWNTNFLKSEIKKLKKKLVMEELK